MSQNLKRLQTICKNAREEYDWVLEVEHRYYDDYSLRKMNSSFLEWKNAQKNVTLFKNQCRLISSICVQRNLPSGNPPWMGKKIATFL